MPFGIGGSSSSSRSSSESQQTSESRAGSVSGGQAVSGSQSQSGQSIAFEDIFAQLFGNASSAAGGIDPSVLTGQANQLFSGGTDFLSQLQGGGVGQNFLEEQLGENPLLQENIDALGADLGDFFNNELLTGITSEAVAGGQLGGGRQGVAQGAAVESVARQFAQGSRDLRNADLDRRTAAAGTLEANRANNANIGLASLPGLFGVAQGGQNATLSPFEQLSNILGGVTTTTDSSSTSFGNSEDFAQSFSDSFSQGTSNSDSTSSSRSLSIGF